MASGNQTKGPRALTKLEDIDGLLIVFQKECEKFTTQAQAELSSEEKSLEWYKKFVSRENCKQAIRMAIIDLCEKFYVAGINQRGQVDS